MSVSCLLKALEPADRKSLLNVTRWFDTCVNQPQFLKVLGKISLCEKMVPVTPKPAAAPNATASPAANSATSGDEPGNGKDLCMWLCVDVFYKRVQVLLCLNGLCSFVLCLLHSAGPPKTEAQLKKEAKKREKMEKFQQKKEMEEKKKLQPQAEVEWCLHCLLNVAWIVCPYALLFLYISLFSNRKKPNLRRRNWVWSPTPSLLHLERKKVCFGLCVLYHFLLFSSLIIVSIFVCFRCLECFAWFVQSSVCGSCLVPLVGETGFL